LQYALLICVVDHIVYMFCFILISIVVDDYDMYLWLCDLLVW